MTEPDPGAPPVNPFIGAPIVVPALTLATLLDIAVQGSAMMSGWWSTEETNIARQVAEWLGVCPNAVTPTDQLGDYPECDGLHWSKVDRNTKRLTGHDDHGRPLVTRYGSTS